MKKYEILDKLGQGGMGVVYKAFQKNLNREVAIKILPKAYSENTEVKKRFVSEMQICGNLVHPNIIRIFDNGEQDGTLYYVMEYVPGTTLLELVQSKGALPVEQALRISGDMLEAMKYYHPMGLVHRDIKPANIMVKAPSGEAVLMDFGLVKALYASGITIQGRLVGTPRYMSPEMLRGFVVDGRSDVFQLGLVLYEMCTGVPAFRGKDRAEVTRRLLEEDPERPSQLNPLLNVSIEHLIANALDKNIDNRYRSAEEFLDDIALVREGGKVHRKGTARTTAALPGITPSGGVEPPAGAPTGKTSAIRTTAPIQAEISPALIAKVTKGLFAISAGLALLLFSLSGPARTAYSARDVQVELDFGEARIQWQSDHPYPTLVEFGESENLLHLEGADGAQSETRHSVLLDDLNEGTEYRYRFLYPGKLNSPLYDFRTPSLTFTTLSARRTGLRAIEVEVQTSIEVHAVLEVTRGSQSERIEGKAGQARTHRFTVGDLPLELGISVRAIAISKSGREKASEALPVPAPAGLARTLAQAAQTFPLKDWFLRSEKALRGRGETRQIGQQLEDLWKQEPVSKALRAFQEIAFAYLSDKGVPLGYKIEAYHGLAAIADLNQYCAARRIPFHVPAEDCMPPEFSSAPAGRVSTEEPYMLEIANPFGFTPRGLAPIGGVMASSKLEATVVVKLPRVVEIRRAELVLGLEVKDPLAIFFVSVNGQLNLRFRQLEFGQSKTYPRIYHTFDARVLREGENKFAVSVGTIPGYGMTESPRVKILALLVHRS